MTTSLPLPTSLAERDALVEQYLPLVRYVVGRLPASLPGALDRDDFHSVGVMGLLHAATHFDPARGASFKTFAYTAIRGAILDEVRRLDPVPRKRRERLRRMDRQHAALRSALDREPTLAELAAVLGCRERDLDDDLQLLASSRTVSLDDPRSSGEETFSLLGQLPDATAVDPAEHAGVREALERVLAAIDELPEADRAVMVLHYREQRYLREIAGDLGVTDSRVSQILTRALARLRGKLAAGD